MDDTNKALAAAVERRGYCTLRPKQQETIEQFMRGNDVFVALSTSASRLAGSHYAIVSEGKLTAMSVSTQNARVDE